MKYIVAALDDKETIFIFPRAVDHDRMAEGIQAIRFGDRHNWSRHRFDIVSAGFVDRGICHGHSETLNLISRGAVDTKLLEGYFAPASDDAKPAPEGVAEDQFLDGVATVLDAYEAEKIGLHGVYDRILALRASDDAKTAEERKP